MLTPQLDSPWTPQYYVAIASGIIVQQQALSAIVAWVRLDRAFENLNAELRRTYGITGLQLSVLRILAERPQLPLAALRKALVMHPATLGQAIDKLRVMDLVTVRRDPDDKRSRNVALTERGAALVESAPLVGPVRLRDVVADPLKLERLAASLEDAIDLFGLHKWAPGSREEPK
jgi:DNA-binding MarR family transcriptional regulator